MTNIIKVGLATATTLLLITGCGGASTTSAEDSMSGGIEMTLQGHHSNKSIQKAIIKVGEEHGWKITEFKSNAVVAEKIDGDDSASATITFDKDKIILMDESGDIDANDLLEYINEELTKEDDHH